MHGAVLQFTLIVKNEETTAENFKWTNDKLVAF